MKVLVTGGTGYIGSHTCVALQEAGHEVVIVDNLSNSKVDVVDKIKLLTKKEADFYKIDVVNAKEFEQVFTKHKFDGVIHFAGYKAVGESVEKPLMYYQNNLISTMNVIEMCVKYDVPKIVFSSSATVYGDNESPFVETMDLLPCTNPYGETKAMCEKILIDSAKANLNLNVGLLRYFNPVGAHTSGLLGENPNGIPNNLMPYVARVAKGILPELSVFGDDYDTVDGTGVRDYLHVVDLADGHVKALEKMPNSINIYNLGTGSGTSVLQLVKAFEEANGIKIPYKITPRRAGDIAVSYADASKAFSELGWKAKLTILDMVRDSWNFEKNL